MAFFITSITIKRFSHSIGTNIHHQPCSTPDLKLPSVVQPTDVVIVLKILNGVSVADVKKNTLDDIYVVLLYAKDVTQFKP
ncbi:hypothetical protein R6Q59_030514 [Mikania micrantha]